MRKFLLFEDPEHSWLRVPKAEINGTLFAVMSEKCFRDESYYYLSKGKDMDLFLERVALAGETIEVVSLFESVSSIRKLDTIRRRTNQFKIP